MGGLLMISFGVNRTLERGRHRTVPLFDTVNAVLLIVFGAAMLYPFAHAIAVSFSDTIAAMTQTISVFPIRPTIDNYRVVLSNPLLINAFGVSVGRTVVGVVYSLLITGLAAYAMSKRQIPGNRAIAIYLIIPMYFTGGLLPLYILIYNLGLFNNFLVYILPHGFWAFNMLIMRTFFDTIPASLEESARIEGASEIYIYFRIIFPLSLPVMATIAMFNGVWQWNQWFDALLYITRDRLLPLQSILQQLLQEALATRMLAEQGIFEGMRSSATLSPEAVKMSTLVVTTVPIVLVYPFLQRYFVKGAVIGAVKG